MTSYREIYDLGTCEQGIDEQETFLQVIDVLEIDEQGIDEPETAELENDEQVIVEQANALLVTGEANGEEIDVQAIWQVNGAELVAIFL